MDPFRASTTLKPLTLPGHISSTHCARKDESRVEMNVSVYQEKKKKEEMKTSMNKVEEGKRQATNFREAAYCPSAIV